MNENLIEIDNPYFIVDLMYAGTKHNITGYPVYAEIGLGNHAFVHRDLWKRLQKLTPWLAEHKMKLKIFDAYRPPIAHIKLKNIVPYSGFFADLAEESPHCRGTAIDVALTDENGKQLNYPTEVDAYTPQYAKEIAQGKFDDFFQHLKKATHQYLAPNDAVAIENRDSLRKLMESIGLEALPHEWWHYELPEGRTNKYPMIEY